MKHLGKNAKGKIGDAVGSLWEHSTHEHKQVSDGEVVQKSSLLESDEFEGQSENSNSSE
eukprot:CAMPEP_0117051298 /NCGR_PEP_ID=MMETSP0472-20121206/35434_1 /TAXON_ID=693140 ORGANISM="Tiarina fusus, Strain LIS" /NCGR_SAMPLE_ID=MMETSP0472 /ASSEMBLY_ACC=CAM_ASM_000603 /LENGTH=58 /DNA_ID=CAMNT_0004765439 /DNA_START=317 /DNA_END=493 /DNA_ORIENTATION=+